MSCGTMKQLSSVELYDIPTNTWSKDIIPDLNEARDFSSCCILESKIYVFGNGRYHYGIEWLDAKSLFAGNKVRWNLLELIFDV